MRESTEVLLGVGNGGGHLPRILIVEDDRTMRELYREQLEDTYEVIDTGLPTEALALALHREPDCILLDLMMSECSGFELCQIFSSLSFTETIPIFVITSKSAAEYKDYCLNLGAAEYFQKPVNFSKLKERLAAVLKSGRPPRGERKIRLTIPLKLKGSDNSGKEFEELAATQQISINGFSCVCSVNLEKGARCDVWLRGPERHVGLAQVIQIAEYSSTVRDYRFEFVGRPLHWILQSS